MRGMILLAMLVSTAAEAGTLIRVGSVGAAGYPVINARVAHDPALEAKVGLEIGGGLLMYGHGGTGAVDARVGIEAGNRGYNYNTQAFVGFVPTLGIYTKHAVTHISHEKETLKGHNQSVGIRASVFSLGIGSSHNTGLDLPFIEAGFNIGF